MLFFVETYWVSILRTIHVYLFQGTTRKHWFVGTPLGTIREEYQPLSILSQTTKHLNVEMWGCVNAARFAISTCEMLQQQTRILFAGLKSGFFPHRTRERKMDFAICQVFCMV